MTIAQYADGAYLEGLILYVENILKTKTQQYESQYTH